MKLPLAVFLTFLCLSVSLNAQGDNAAALVWQTVATEGARFSAEMPFGVKDKSFRDKDSAFFENYSAYFDKTFFFIIAFQKGKTDFKDAVVGFVQEKNITKERVEFQSAQDKLYVFQDDDSFFHRVLLIWTPDKYYVFQTISESEQDSNIDRFFKSIKAFNLPIKNLSTVQLSDSKKVLQNDNSTNTKNTKPLSNNTETSKTDKSPDSNQPTSISPLRILSKPKPSYTELARIYEIEGVVRLRVTFLANSTIGSVVPLTKLPFGLTTKAINAAKGISFEPAARNSIPANIIKVVEYNFTMF